MVLESIGALATLASVLQTWKASADGKTKRRQQALSALSDAVASTTALLTSTQKTTGNHPKLVNAWRQASIALKAAREDKLAALCKVKGIYWIDPSQWSQEHVRSAGIQLKSMERELRRLLDT